MDSSVLIPLAVAYGSISIIVIVGSMFNWGVNGNPKDALLALTGWAWPLWLLWAFYLMVRDVLRYVRTSGWKHLLESS